jgi:hypothetical protein
MRIALLALSPLAFTLIGCTTTATAQPASKESGPHWVRDIQLEPLRGEVGKPFQGKVTWDDNYIRDPEVEVSGLPPGLIYDPATRTVSGSPKQAGFFSVNVNIRKHVRVEPGHRPSPDEHWWPATFQLEVYKPMKD